MVTGPHKKKKKKEAFQNTRGGGFQRLQRSHILEAAVTDTLHRRLLMGHLIH